MNPFRDSDEIRNRDKIPRLTVPGQVKTQKLPFITDTEKRANLSAVVGTESAEPRYRSKDRICKLDNLVYRTYVGLRGKCDICWICLFK